MKTTIRSSRWLLEAVLICTVSAQTRVDLKTQGKSVDFSGVPTKPFRTGTALPSTCSVGETFFKTDAPAGSNFFGCTATNLWSLQAPSVMGLPSIAGQAGKVLAVTGSESGWASLGGDVSGTAQSVQVQGLQGRHLSTAAPTDGQALVWNGASAQWEPKPVSSSGGLAVLAITRTSDTVLTIGGNCTPTTPCNIRFGSSVYSIQGFATAILTGGTGTAYIYAEPGGRLTVGHNVQLSCTGCQSQSGVTAFPNDSIPIASWSAAAGSWSAQGTDWRAWLSTKVLQAGTGVAIIDAGAASTVVVDPAVVPTYVRGSATLDLPTIASGSCSNDMTFPLPGASPGNTVAPGWPDTMLFGTFGMMYVSGSDTVSVRLCNLSGITVNPTPAIFSATIIRSF